MNRAIREGLALVLAGHAFAFFAVADTTLVEFSHDTPAGSSAMSLAAKPPVDVNHRPLAPSTIFKSGQPLKLGFVAFSAPSADVQAGDGGDSTDVDANSGNNYRATATARGFALQMSVSACGWNGTTGAYTVNINGLPTGVNCGAATCSILEQSTTYGTACSNNPADYSAKSATGSSNAYSGGMGPNSKKCYLAKSVVSTPYDFEGNGTPVFCQCTPTFPPLCTST